MNQHGTRNQPNPSKRERRRARIAGLLVACAALAVALFVALRDPKPNEVAKQQPDVPAPNLKEKEPEPKVAPKPMVATLPANPKAGDEYDIEIAPNTKMRFCYIPAGECQLGSPQAERDALLLQLDDEEVPEWRALEDQNKRGKFSTKGFWMGKYEVTQAQWAAVMPGSPLAAPSTFRIGNLGGIAFGSIRDTSQFPVESVSPAHCREFLTRANAHRVSLGEKGAFDLPHEDEWEYACRGGLGNARPFYFGDALNGTQANCNGEFPFGTTKGNFLKRPQPVGSYESKARHPWGLCDMHGNVREWCRNIANDKFARYLVRGGSWASSAQDCRAAFRSRVYLVALLTDLGLRLLFTKP